MIGFLSLIDKRGIDIKADLLKQVIGYSNKGRLTTNEIWINGNIGIFQNEELRSSSGPKAQNVFIGDDQSIALCLDSRLDYRKELADKMKLDWGVYEHKSDDQFLYNAYLNWKKSCVKHLYGDFSFCIWDIAKGELFCGRDHFGCRPLYWFENESFLCISTEIAPFFRIPEHGITVNQSSIVEFLISKLPISDETFFNNISRLQPASILTYNKNDGLFINRYWELIIPEKKKEISFEAAASELKLKLTNSINERLKYAHKVGAELSGGIDSSSIVAIASQVCKNMGKSFEAFSHTMDVDWVAKRYPFNDESQYSNALVSYSNIINHSKITSRNKGIIKSITDVLKLLVIPQHHSFVYLSDALLEKAHKDQVNVLLSGFGGDEGITSDHEELIQKLVKQKKWRVVKEIIRRKNDFGKYGYCRDNVTIFFHILFSKLRGFRYKLFPKETIFNYRYNAFPLSNELKKEYDIGRIQPSSIRSNIKLDPDTKRISRFNEKHISYRIENAYNYARTFNIEYAYPFLDVKLLEFYFSVPVEYQYYKGQGRSLIRQAMNTMLPDDIRLRDDKTKATLPSVQSRLLTDYNDLKEIIEDAKRSNQIHYINYNKAITMLEDLKLRDDGKVLTYGPKHFFNIIQILILQKWQREGKIDIGIKC